MYVWATHLGFDKKAENVTTMCIHKLILSKYNISLKVQYVRIGNLLNS